MGFFYFPPGGSGGSSGGLTETQVKVLLHHKTNFTNVATVSVTHNLGRQPSVTVVDTAGTEYEADVTHNGVNSLVVTFASPMSGSIYCN